jgi:hypothetical protein
MAETKRMTTEQVVGYLLEGEGLDFLRESLGWVVQQLMEVEVSELVGAARGERACGVRKCGFMLRGCIRGSVRRADLDARHCLVAASRRLGAWAALDPAGRV